MTILAVTQTSHAKEETTLVGYVETTTITNDRDAMLNKIDISQDGAINFKEFQRAALLSNEYEMFDMNDTNNDSLLSLDEYRNFSKESPAYEHDPESSTKYNFNKKRP